MGDWLSAYIKPLLMPSSIEGVEQMVRGPVLRSSNDLQIGLIAAGFVIFVHENPSQLRVNKVRSLFLQAAPGRKRYRTGPCGRSSAIRHHQSSLDPSTGAARITQRHMRCFRGHFSFNDLIV
jgi:hypothetical protein